MRELSTQKSIHPASGLTYLSIWPIVIFLAQILLFFQGFVFLIVFELTFEILFPYANYKTG